MALELEKRLREIHGVTITQKVEANGIFIIMPAVVAERLSKDYFFYPWDPQTSEYRLMTSWDTTMEDIVQFTELLKVIMDEKR